MARARRSFRSRLFLLIAITTAAITARATTVSSDVLSGAATLAVGALPRLPVSSVAPPLARAALCAHAALQLVSNIDAPAENVATAVFAIMRRLAASRRDFIDFELTAARAASESAGTAASPRAVALSCAANGDALGSAPWIACALNSGAISLESLDVPASATTVWRVLPDPYALVPSVALLAARQMTGRKTTVVATPTPEATSEPTFGHGGPTPRGHKSNAFPEFPEVPPSVDFALAVAGFVAGIDAAIFNLPLPSREAAVALSAELGAAASAEARRAGTDRPYVLNASALRAARDVRDADRKTLAAAHMSLASSLPSPEEIAALSDESFARSEAVRRSFSANWDSYARVALGHDVLRPLSGVGAGDVCQLGETVADSLDTAALMGLPAPWLEGTAWVRDSFAAAIGGQADINVFECTIRVIGGLLGAHDLGDADGSGIFLGGAEAVARALVESGAYSSPTGIPYGTVYLAKRVAPTAGERVGECVGASASPSEVTNHSPSASVPPKVPSRAIYGVVTPCGHAYNPDSMSGASAVSEVGTLQLEMSALSARGRSRYAYHAMAEKAQAALMLAAPVDGLFPILVNPQTGLLFTDAPVTLGARGDSVYEYFVKQWIALGGWRAERVRAAALADFAVALDAFESAQTAAATEDTDAARARALTALSAALRALSAFASDDPRPLLRAYNQAVVGIFDRLLHRSTPSALLYVAEQTSPASAKKPHKPASISHKMDHLVCFLPGTLALGLVHGAGHESLARSREASIRLSATASAILGRGDADADSQGVPTWDWAYAAENDLESDQDFRGSAAADAVLRVIPDTPLGEPPPPPLPPNTPQFTFRAMQNAPPTVDIAHEMMSRVHARVERWSTSGKKAMLEDARAALGNGDVSTVEGASRDASGPAAQQAPGTLASLLRSFTSSLGETREKGGEGSSRAGDVLGAFEGVRRPSVARAVLLRAARDLTRTCVALYDRSPTGLAPEIVTFSAGADFSPNKDARHSLLRPETLESLFILRAVGFDGASRDGEDEDWCAAAGWRIFSALERHARLRGRGHAAVADIAPGPLAPLDRNLGGAVPSAGRSNMLDRLDSFVLAETLKYAYFLASPRGGGEHAHGDWKDILTLNGWVFNTEAHPLRISSDGPSAWKKVDKSKDARPEENDGEGQVAAVDADDNDTDL